MVSKSIPLARQVVQEILTGIQAGSLARSNGMLPSETELGARFDVSRATIREALAQLEQRGVVVRKHGIGTLVAQTPRIDTGLEELASLETLAHQIGLETQMGDLQIAERPATPTETSALQLAPASAVLAVSRVIVANKRPVAFLIDTVPTSILKKQDLARNFRGSVLDLFIQRKLPLSHSRTDILIELADKIIARKLKIKAGEPLHKLDAQLFTRDGCVVDYSISYFVPGYFRFHVIRRVGNSGQK